MTSSNDKDSGYGSKFPYDAVRDDALEDIVSRWARPGTWIQTGAFTLVVLAAGYWLGIPEGLDKGPTVVLTAVVALIALIVGATLYFNRRPRKGSASDSDTSS